MPRWKALPDGLDPQIAEFVSQLRRLVDRGGLGIAALADATGYSKTSWERYLNGRLLAPKGAIVALAEVTGTHPVHLTTMWELAERAWSRSEMRHDMTIEAIRISQARAALGEPGAAGAVSGGAAARCGGAHRAARGAPGPGAAAPVVPAQPTAADSPDAHFGAQGFGAPGGPTEGNSWGMAGYRGPSPTGPVHRARPEGAPPAAGNGGPAGGPPPSPGRGRPAPGGRLTPTTLIVGLVGVLVVIAGAVFVLNGGDRKKPAAEAEPSPSPTAATTAALPPGVKCGGDVCTGKDPEAMGCGGELVTTAASTTVGAAAVEVRYSSTCGTAWARVTQAGAGDQVRISAGGDPQSSPVVAAGSTSAYTPMVAVRDAADARACVTLAAGQEGCTR
ncbi:helix-turn-helix domain-containing protein [Streptomyces sp. SHP 1-2]|uniref:helix-turn-helix domain-containing protein n=1 Tax=Streptomyces sp. SHP 1-2 TaxID=2769489 RepID=UPI002237492F|nr:XRE family transcriptional regulator [Streptomyces sp. SHP 1-2]MCW5251592.1 XRE family transcriptional regulator [Streptomyces sp. SHP 1-2]